jgi:hypothetical protein
MYKALSIQKIRQKYKNADITQDTLLTYRYPTDDSSAFF